MSLKSFTSWACPSTSQMFKPTRMFSWYQSFTIGPPWRKGRKVSPADSKVVLTNMKIINNEKMGNEEPGEGSPESSKEAGATESGVSQQAVSLAPLSEASEPSADVSTLPGLKHHVPRLVKIESEDSGVELPSRPNSPSTPRGSEKSFALHSRDSSCDSGVLSASSSPAADHVVKRTSKDPVDHCPSPSDGKEPAGCCAGETSAVSLKIDLDCPGGRSPEVPFFNGNQHLEGQTSEGGNAAITLVASAVDRMPSDDYGSDGLDGLALGGQPLRKYPTSDSLDEYMDECCRLSKVNQGNAKALGSGLGYLEHICQLIEKIGQLQEHNLRLQKQVCNLQKEQRTNQLNEEYFLHRCCCGAASIFLSSHQEVKSIFPGKNRPQSLLVQNGIMSDLSIIPEAAGGSSEKSSKERDDQLDLENNWLIMKLKASNGRKSEVNMHTEGASLAEGQDYLQKDPTWKGGESHAWGRMKELMRKSRGRSQSRLGMVPASLKRSCPQLYRPDTVSSDLRKMERNSMIALGQGSRNGSGWPF